MQWYPIMNIQKKFKTNSGTNLLKLVIKIKNDTLKLGIFIDSKLSPLYLMFGRQTIFEFTCWKKVVIFWGLSTKSQNAAAYIILNKFFPQLLTLPKCPN